MFENRQNLCNRHRSPSQHEWHDDAHLAPACKERFLTLTEIPEWQRRYFMAGLAELHDGYHVERDKVVHTLLFTLEGGVLITPNYAFKEIEPTR